MAGAVTGTPVIVVTDAHNHVRDGGPFLRESVVVPPPEAFAASVVPHSLWGYAVLVSEISPSGRTDSDTV